MTIESTKETLSRMVAERSLKRKEFFKSYKKPEGRTTPPDFKPLPSDLILDAKSWPEWTLDNNYNVIQKETTQ